jgi:hypothetical protein
MRLVVDARTANVDRGRVGQQTFFFGVSVEAGHRAQPAGDRRPGTTSALKLPAEQLNVGTPRLEEVQAVVVAPGDVLAQVKL